MSTNTAAAPAATPAGKTPGQRRIALVAHDNKKEDLCEWARYNRGLLVWNIPIACNRASADFLISSPLMSR